VRVAVRRIMQTNMGGVFHERVSEWYYLWSQLGEFPTLAARGLEMAVQVSCRRTGVVSVVIPVDDVLNFLPAGSIAVGQRASRKTHKKPSCR